ncbi:MAG: PSD1 and planctomycete cytochrome C domain-containing protein [Pirellulaceae bacterium]|nr:PSD1 and planctomycete cytochrome C domain-containing protein [Pirellulaceae bacterium]
MRPSLISLISLILLVLPLQAAVSQQASRITRAEEDFFESRIRPLLAAKCLECHGPDTQEAGLRIDSRAALLKGSEKHPVVVPGAPSKSSLLTAVNQTTDLKMPPDEKLSDDQLAALREWIKMGLPWPANKPLSRTDSYDAILANHWSLQPVRTRPFPVVQQAQWPVTGIDYYILARLEQAGLTPSPAAGRRELIRRVMFDLVGLAPTAAQTQQFLDDSAPDAYQRLLDRVLASPQYGERWGRYWLDVARYSDTVGYNFMKERRFPFSYTYRDYVVRALNSDKPYDQFIMEQLAADLMKLDDNRNLAAMGFLTVGRRYRNEQLDVDDRIDTMTRGMLGLTVSCARCHDHKYDAIPTRDYYSLYGVFASSQIPADEQLPLIGTAEETPYYQEFKRKLDSLEGKLRNHDRVQALKFTLGFRSQLVDYLVRAIAAPSDEQLAKLDFLKVPNQKIRKAQVVRWRKFLIEEKSQAPAVMVPIKTLAVLPAKAYSDKREMLLEKLRQQPAGTAPGQVNPLLKQRLLDSAPENKIQLARVIGELLQEVYLKSTQKGVPLSEAEQQIRDLVSRDGTPTHVTLKNVKDFYNRDDNNKRQGVLRPVEQHKAFARGNPPRAMVLSEKPKPYDPRVFIRGQSGRKGDQVPRQFLYVVSGKDRQPFKQGSGRLEMAQAIANPSNSLTARVITNRIWMHHLTTPIVTTPSDFGIRSDRPIHLDVLDYLAASLVQSGWSIKQLHREIMLSATYRQSSVDREAGRQIDTDNSLYWRMNRRRLDYEAMRDSLLQAVDTLDLTMGGPSESLTESTSLHRRAIYTFVDRQDLPGLLRVFDFPNPDQHSARRPSTTVPQQALFLMNSAVVIERVKRWTTSRELADLDTDDRIRRYYQQFFQRAPSEQELQIGRNFVNRPPDAKGGSKLGPWGQYAQLLLLSNEFHFID